MKNKMYESKNDLCWELYIMDYAIAFVVMLGGLIFVIAAHVDQKIPLPKLLNWIK